jgi:hypothetical protein
VTNVKLPAVDQRLAICGSTGSGKTIAGLWHLSEADINLRPWFIFDFKRDKNIAKLTMTELDVKIGRLPSAPGIYVFRPIPEQDDLLVKEILWKIWAQENCGVYIDEGYMIGRNNSAFNALLTQGRSKHIQMITLSQRPAWMSRFVFSEADYFQVFRLNDKRDYDTVQAMCGVDIRSRLPEYWSHWYEVAADRGVVFRPAPKPSEIIDRINSRLKNKIGMI